MKNTRLSATLLTIASIAVCTSPKLRANGNCGSPQVGQQLINNGQYANAVQVFTCLINAQPTEVEGYRGRIEAQLLLNRFSDAVRDYARVTANVLPVHPDAQETILDGYSARLAAKPNDIPALTGASFAQWWLFEYGKAIQLLNKLLDVDSKDVYGNLFRGSSRMLNGTAINKGAADLDRAILLAPFNPQVRFIVADAYTYGADANPTRAFAEASFALFGGIDTPRIHAILAASHFAWNNQFAAALHIRTHISQVTQQLMTTTPLAAGAMKTLPLIPGRTYEIPIVVSTPGQQISIATASEDFWDTVLVLLAPNGTPVVASDDLEDYFAGLQQWAAPTAGTYRLLVTSFESVSTGNLVVSRTQ